MLRGHRHNSIADMKTAVQRALKAIPVQDFHDAIHSLPMRWMKCIQAQGEYFEGLHVQVDPDDFRLEVVLDDEETSEDEP